MPANRRRRSELDCFHQGQQRALPRRPAASGKQILLAIGLSDQKARHPAVQRIARPDARLRL